MKKAIFSILEMRVVDVWFERIAEWGLCFFESREIIIRDSLCERNQIRVLIHEHIHYLRPQWDEGKVIEKEEIVYRSLTEEEYGLLKEYLDFWKNIEAG